MLVRGLLLLLVFSTAINLADAQSNFVSLGASATAQTGNLAYSIGQPAYNNARNTSGSLEVGVQQPYQFVTITSVSNVENLKGLKIFPVPVKQNFWIKFDNELYQSNGVKLNLVNIYGQILYDLPLKTNLIKVDVAALTPSVYFLKIIQNAKVLHVQKIIVQ
jgi:hypothetical protein